MDEAEDAYPDPRLEALIRESGMAWPRDDAQLDAWLSAQALSDDDERWLKEVMLRRLHEARGPSLGIDLGPAEAGEPEAASVTVKSAPARPRRLTYDDLALLNGQLLELVEVGVALPVGLQAFAEDVRGGELEHVLARLRADLEQGLPLSAALARQGEAFPPLYRSLVSAGEAGGDLAACLGLLHEQAEVDAEFDRRVREALAYPGVAFLAAALAVVAIVFLVTPAYDDLLSGMGVELPALTTALFGASRFVRDHVLLSLGAAALAVGGVVWGGPKLLPHVVRRSSRWWKPSRTLGEFARALAGFLQRGLALPQALGALEAAQLNLPTGTLTRVRERVEAGESLADALRDEPVFPASFVWVIGAAQRRGDLPETLRSLALRQEREHQRRVRRIEVLVAPLGLSFVGLLVGAVALSVFLPVFEMQKALQQ